jgi:hypothetical protein
VNDGSGADNGQGGSGNATGQGNQPESDLDLQTVYAPPARPEGSGDDLQLPGRPDESQPEVDAGPVQGQGERNDALVPYLDVLAQYAERATQTVEQGGYPVRLRGTVREYFDRLADPAAP